MNELHQKLAVLSSSLHSTSPQQMGESPLQMQLQQQQQYQPSLNNQGSVIYSPIPAQGHHLQAEIGVSQMVVDSTTSFGKQQQLQPPLPQNVQHQMQTVVVNNPMLQSNNSSSSGCSPLVLSVPVNINNNSNSSCGSNMGSPAIVVPVQSNFHPTTNIVAPPMPMQIMHNNNNINMNNQQPQQQQLTQPNVSVVQHPSLVTTIATNPIPTNNNSTPSQMTNQQLHHHQQQQPQHHHHYHPINDLTASSSSSSAAHTTTTSIVTTTTTNKLIEAVTHQGTSSAAVLSVSI